MGALVSVIVPAYNAEKYIGQCVESVRSQTHEDWELIAVDDGSTDRTGEILASLAALEPRIRVVTRPNGGLSMARNDGLRAARGEYITFLDADDLLPRDYLATLVEAVRATGAPIAEVPMVRFRGEPHLRRSGGEVEVINSLKAVEHALYQRKVSSSVCGKLYAAGIWENTLFRERSLYEDLDIFYRAVLRGGKIAVTRKTAYFYRYTPGSILHTFTAKRADVLDVTARIRSFIEREHPSILPAAKDRQFAANFNILYLTYRHSHRDRELRERCRSAIRELRGEIMRNRESRFKNRAAAALSYLFF